MAQKETCTPVGADLIIPAMAGAYAAYYVFSVREFALEAQISGIVLAGLVGVLVLIYFARVAAGFARRKYSMGLGDFLGPRESRRSRGAFFALIVAYIAVVPYLGFTLTTFAFLAGAFLVSGVRPMWKGLLIAGVAAIVGWLFFIVILDTQFPTGPFEHAVGALT